MEQRRHLFLCTHEAALRGFVHVWQQGPLGTCPDKHSSESIHWEQSSSSSKKRRKVRGKSKITGYFLFFLVSHLVL